MYLPWLWRTEGSPASGSNETAAKHGLSGGAGTSLSMFEVQTDVQGLSRENDVSPDLAMSQRARGQLPVTKTVPCLLETNAPVGTMISQTSPS